MKGHCILDVPRNDKYPAVSDGYYTIDTLYSLQTAGDLTLAAPARLKIGRLIAAGSHHIRLNSPYIETDSISDSCRLSLDAQSHLRIRNNNHMHSGWSLEGGQLEFDAGSWIDNVTLTDCNLSAPHSRLTNMMSRSQTVSESINEEGPLAEVRELSVTLHDMRRSYLRAAARSPIQVVADRGADSSLEGATLLDVRVPLNSDGVKSMAALGQAHLVALDIRHLCGGHEFRVRWPRRKVKPDPWTSERIFSNPGIEEAYVRDALENLAGRGADGTTISLLKWWQYRLAQKRDKSSSLDKMLLFLYRLIGYGERPGPPALTWLVTCLLSAPLWMPRDTSATSLLGEYLLGVLGAATLPIAVVGAANVPVSVPRPGYAVPEELWTMLLVLVLTCLIISLSTTAIALRKRAKL